jgi:hypothetical protein
MFGSKEYWRYDNDDFKESFGDARCFLENDDESR